MDDHFADISSAIFIDEVDDELLCNICHNVLSSAVACQNGHPFCEECLLKWLSVRQDCPVCKIDLDAGQLTKLRFVEALIGKLLVKCEENVSSISDIRRKLRDKNENLERPRVSETPPSDATVPLISSGTEETGGRCCWTGKFADLRKHMNEECEYRKVSCPNAGCEANDIERRHLAGHLAQCPYRLIECEYCHNSIPFCSQASHVAGCESVVIDCRYGCGASFARKDEIEHRKSDCPLTKMDCPYARFGCPSKRIRRCDLEDHEQSKAQDHCRMMAARLHSLAEDHTLQVERVSAFLDAKKFTEYSANWTISNIAEMLGDEEHPEVFSRDVCLSITGGSFRFGLQAEAQVGGIAIFILQEALPGSTRPYPLDMRGTSITIQHPSNPSQSKNISFPIPRAILQGSDTYLGAKVNAEYIRAFTKDNSINLTVYFRIQNKDPISLN
jgi:hypothetical protein